MSTVVAFATATGERYPHRATPFLIELKHPEDFRQLAIHAIRNSKRKYKDIATAAGVTASTVGKLAADETQFPRMTTVISIIIALGYTFTARIEGPTTYVRQQ